MTFQLKEFSGQLGKELLANTGFMAELGKNLGQLIKADTISQATGLLWYDLKPIVQSLYPYKELIPLISKLPRTPYNGGNMAHWKRIVAIDFNGNSLGVSEGNRGSRITVTEQDQAATYKTLGRESSVTFQAQWGSKNLDPRALAIGTQATLRSVMMGEESVLIGGNAALALGITPTPTLSASGSGGAWGGTVTVYVICVALTGMGLQGYTPYNSTTNTGGIPGQITKQNADGSTDTYGGGSAQPSVENSVGSVTTTEVVTATVAAVTGAAAYAWFAGTASGAEKLCAITATNQIILTQPPSSTQQPITNLQVGGSYQDNSVNALLPDGILTQIYGSVFGAAPGTAMSTNQTALAANLAIGTSGALVYTMPNANTGLTISGSNINEFDTILQAAYDLYKVGFDRILMSSTDLTNSLGAFFGSGDTAAGFRMIFDADATAGRIVAGRRVTTYMNKVMNKPLDIDVHPFVPPGTIIFWSDRVPYELSGVGNLFEAIVRQDYYQIEWPWKTMRYEYGVYVDEVFANYFLPAFAVVRNVNPTSGTPHF